jgi:hypothetical protein
MYLLLDVEPARHMAPRRLVVVFDRLLADVREDAEVIPEDR